MRYDQKFKEGAVRLVVEGGQTISAVAKGLRITENKLGPWEKD